MTMIVTWLIELYLNQLGELRDQGDKSKVDFDMLQEEFRKFLAQTRVKVGTRLLSWPDKKRIQMAHRFNAVINR